MASQLLTDIVYFVAYQEYVSGDPFDVEQTNADRERPKLLREQNILKQVCSLISFVLLLLVFTVKKIWMKNQGENVKYELTRFLVVPRMVPLTYL